MGKRLFRSSGYVILLYGQSCSSFNRIVLWTVKNKNVFLLIHSFLYLLERPPVKGREAIIYEQLYPFRINLNQLDLNLLNPSWSTSSVHSLSSKNISLSSDCFFFCWGSAQFNFILTNISSNMLRNFLHCFLKVTMYNWLGMSITFTHSFQEYSAFLQHWHSKGATCFIMASLTFLPTSASDSSLLNLAFEFLISSVNWDVAVYC